MFSLFFTELPLPPPPPPGEDLSFSSNCAFPPPPPPFEEPFPPAPDEAFPSPPPPPPPMFDEGPAPQVSEVKGSIISFDILSGTTSQCSLDSTAGSSEIWENSTSLLSTLVSAQSFPIRCYRSSANINAKSCTRDGTAPSASISYGQLARKQLCK